MALWMNGMIWRLLEVIWLTCDFYKRYQYKLAGCDDIGIF